MIIFLYLSFIYPYLSVSYLLLILLRSHPLIILSRFSGQLSNAGSLNLLLQPKRISRSFTPTKFLCIHFTLSPSSMRSECMLSMNPAEGFLQSIIRVKQNLSREIQVYVIKGEKIYQFLSLFSLSIYLSIFLSPSLSISLSLSLSLSLPVNLSLSRSFYLSI